MLTRVLKKRASRGHQRTGSDMNMKKISLNQLVESLTPVSTLPGFYYFCFIMYPYIFSPIYLDLMDINAFLMTYRTFTTTQHLVRKLLQRYFASQQIPKQFINFKIDTWCQENYSLT